LTIRCLQLTDNLRLKKLVLEVSEKFPKDEVLFWCSQIDISQSSHPFTSLFEMILHESDRPVIEMALKCLNSMLKYVGIQRYVLENQQNVLIPLYQILVKMMDNISWELRDSTLELIGSIYGENSLLLESAIHHKIHDLVLKGVRDEELYVRSCALQTLQIICKNLRSWTSILESHENFSLGSLSTLSDGESIPKRDAVDLFISWLTTSHCYHQIVWLSRQEQGKMREKVSKLFDEEDWEVKNRGVKFLKLVLLSSMEQENALEVFSNLDGDAMLLEALKNYDRVTRLEACYALQEVETNFSKILEINVSSPFFLRLKQFYETLRTVDLDTLIQDANPENIYDSDEENDLMMEETTIIDCE